MAFVAVPDAAKCVVRFNFGFGVWTNNLWFTQSIFEFSDLETLALTVDTLWGGALRPYLSSECYYLSTLAYDMRVPDGAIATSDTGKGFGSQAVGSMLPAQDAMVLTLRTANRGRSSRGRLYIAGFSESQWADGTFSTGLDATVEGLWGAMRVAALLAAWQPVVVSRQLNHVARTPPVTQTILDVEVRSLVPGAQRRRLARP